jgi:branched-chain amino acid transport system substrate-binding protein
MLSFVVALSLLSNGAFFAQPSIGQSEPEPIKIGFVTTLTGPSGVGGRVMVNGIKLYLDHVHYRMAGRKVELIVENDGGNPATAVEKLHKLVQEDKVQIADGFMLSNVAYAAAPHADTLQIPTVFPITGADDLTKRNRHEWVIRTGWCSSQCSQPFGEYAYKTLHYKRIVTLGVDFPLGWELVGGFQKTFEDAGGKVVQKIWVPLGFSDFSTFLKSIRGGADAVLVATALTPAEIIPKQYKEFGPKLPVIAVGPSCDESSIKKLGDEVAGIVSTMYYSAALNTPANRHFVEAYEAKYNDPCCHYAEAAYTSGMWINQAVDSLKGQVEDRKRLLAALKKVQLTNAPRGPVKLDSYGNPIENYYVCKVEMVNGKPQNTVIHTFPNVSQFWKYKPDVYLSQPPYDRGYPACRFCN